MGDRTQANADAHSALLEWGYTLDITTGKPIDIERLSDEELRKVSVILSRGS